MPSLREIDEYLTNLSIGLGRGFSNQLQGVLGMIENPVQTAKGLYQVASQPQQIPGMVRNALADVAQRGTSGPMGFGEVLGENMGLRLPRGPSKLDMTVYHGSPHNFDKFDMSKIGTGEGAQAYGHGLYVAESPDVAKTYRQVAATQPGFGNFAMSDAARAHLGKLEAQADKAGNRTAAGVYSELTVGDFPPDVLRRKLDASLKVGELSPAEHAQGVAALDTAVKELQKFQGALYTVDLPDSAIANMLDWDAPLSQQPELLGRLRKAGYALADDDSLSGAEFYRKLTQEMGADPEDISKDLLANGITGIRYLDGNSRTNMFRPTTEGTRNFVVFDDKLLKILNKE